MVEALIELGFEACFPEYVPAWRKARGGKSVELVPVFSGYVFVSFDPADRAWWRLYQLRNPERGLESMLGVDAYRPIALPAGDMERLMAEPEVVADVLPPSLVGRSVTVVDGPLSQGWNRFVGVCEWSSEDRVRVLLSCFGARPTSVLMDRSHVELVT